MTNKKIKSPWIIILLVIFVFIFLLPKLACDNYENTKTDAHKEQQAKIDEADKLAEIVHSKIKSYLIENLNDFKSYQAVYWYPLTKVGNQKYDYYIVHSYRAKNRFGALVLRTQIFCMDSDYNVVRVKEQEE